MCVRGERLLGFYNVPYFYELEIFSVIRRNQNLALDGAMR